MLHGTNNYKWDDTMTNHDSLPLGGGVGVGFTIIATTPVKNEEEKSHKKFDIQESCHCPLSI